MIVKNNKYIQNELDAIMQYTLESVLSLFLKEGYRMEDSDFQVVYDLKSEIVEKWLPQFNINVEEDLDER